MEDGDDDDDGNLLRMVLLDDGCHYEEDDDDGHSDFVNLQKETKNFKLYRRSLKKTNKGNFEKGQYTLPGVKMITNSR